MTIRPIPRALVPSSSSAATAISAPNYDEFQGDGEVWSALQRSPDCVLKVTMAHCDAATLDAIDKADSPTSLERARLNMQALARSPLVREAANVLFVYAITHPERPGFRQIGLGGNAPTAEIRTEAQPEGHIIRNEGVREPKALGRAHLIEATGAIIGTVNLAVPDADGQLAGQLEATADRRAADLETTDEHGYRHHIWIVSESEETLKLQALLEKQPEAYVADGNHRSAAAAMLGHTHFLTVFFCADRMAIAPYNRLLEAPELPKDELSQRLGTDFDVRVRTEPGPYQPTEVRSIGFYGRETGWLELTPRSHAFDPDDAAQCIDHDIVQRCLFDRVFGIEDPRDALLTFVGANKDASWLQQQVDEGTASYAVTLAAVTMPQFIEVCRQNRMMPPKSTWFEPKIRSGLVMSLLD